MTRETKIGLLVGLAFIIVIGILLSDHLTSATEPQQAQLAQVAGNVRTAVVVPGAQAAPPITAVPPQQPVAPQQPVPTKEELTPKQPPVEIVQIGPGAQAQQQHPQQTTVVVHPQQPKPQQVAGGGSGDASPPTAQASESGVAGTDGSSQPVARPVPPANSTLARVAHSLGEEVVPAGQSAQQQQQPPADPARPQQTAVAIPAGAKQYKAEPGDTLGKIASKTLGTASKPARDAIIALNPSLQKNPDIVVSGRTYIIPPAGSVQLAAVAASTGAPAPAPAIPAAPAAPIQVANVPAPATPAAPTAPPAAPGVMPVAPSNPEYFYTVKPGDSLTKIAVEQLGTASAVQAIKDLNADALKGGDMIRSNMKLKLPAKPLAAAE